jgi:hypothetical protein
MPSTGQVFVKFDTGDFYENLSRKSKLGENQTDFAGTKQKV